MIRYWIRKFLYLIVTIWVIVTATFFLMKATPGDPFTDEKAVPKEVLESLYRHYGLDQPVYKQYLKYMYSVITWDLGPSFKYKTRSVNQIINDSFPVSFILGLEALLLAISFGILLGTVAALKHNAWQDYLSVLVAIIGISVPSFILASFLQYLFSMKLGWFPVARWGTFKQSVLPAISLAMLPMAYIARLTRSSMLDILQMDFIKTAKGKGLNNFTIITKHALRNALLPIISYLGPLTTNILAGSFVVEKIFGIPGLGQWMVTSINNRDYTVIMGTTLFYAILLLSSIFLVDILYGFVDPRIQVDESKKNRACS
jgi:oligopeptide transport system permease protein